MSLTLTLLLSGCAFPGAPRVAGRATGAQSLVTLLDRPGFDSWRGETGDWRVVEAVYQDPKNENRLAWDCGEGAAVNGENGRTGHLFSKVEHGDVEAHVEFMVPKGSNSGVYFMGRYEIQVLDSWGVVEPQHSDCGGIYQRWGADGGYEGIPPRVNAARAPGEWQTFDVIFRAPRFNSAGEKIENARFVKVWHNGVLVHENEEVTGPTRAAAYNDEQLLGPLMLQGDHGPVAYRNIRLVMPESDFMKPYRDLEQEGAIREMSEYEFGISRECFTKVGNFCEQAAPELRVFVEDDLVALLQSSSAKYDAKQFACRLLRKWGSDRSIPVLTELLYDEDLSHMARWVLQRREGKGIDRALRKALRRVDGDLKIGMVGSLGQRGDAWAVGPIANLVESDDEDLATAAVRALGEIGNPRAARALRRADVGPALEGLRKDALLLCGDRLLEDGRTWRASKVYARLLEEDNATPVRVAALRGYVLSKGEEALPLLLDMLGSSDIDLSRAAASFTTSIAGTETTRELTGAIADLPPHAQAALLAALAERGDPIAREAVAASAQSANPSVRNAALEALAAIGNADSVKVLFAAIAGGDEDSAGVARNSLILLDGPGVEDRIAAGLQNDDATVRNAAAVVLGRKRATSAAGALVIAARDEDADVCLAALEALNVVAGGEQLADLIVLTADLSEVEERSAAQRAARSAASREENGMERATDLALAQILTTKSDEGRASLVSLLGDLRTEKALEALVGKVDDSAEAVREAAIRSLKDWPDRAPADTLARLATRREKGSIEQVLALQGHIRMLQMDAAAGADLLSDYRKAMDLCARDDERNEVLNGVRRVASLEALRWVEGYFGKPGLRARAEEAYLQIARALSGSDLEKAVDLLRARRDKTDDEEFARKLDEAVEHLQKFSGAVAAWVYSGPYMVEGKTREEIFDTVFPPESDDASGVEWLRVEASGANGIPGGVNLTPLVDGGSRVCYLRAEVKSPSEQAALLELGSDDGSAAWFNGEKVVSSNTNRGMGVAQDKAEVTLQAGWNILLLKVSQHDGGSAAYARIAAPDGGALEGLEFRAR